MQEPSHSTETIANCSGVRCAVWGKSFSEFHGFVSPRENWGTNFIAANLPLGPFCPKHRDHKQDFAQVGGPTGIHHSFLHMHFHKKLLAATDWKCLTPQNTRTKSWREFFRNARRPKKKTLFTKTCSRTAHSRFCHLNASGAKSLLCTIFFWIIAQWTRACPYPESPQSDR